MDVNRYLARINLTGPFEPTAENLLTLQKAHLFSVPYENLDILANRPIVLDKDALYEKIVLRRRGGYCFELNELFGHLLRALGYDVIDCFGRFLRGEKEIPMRRHHVLIVTPANSSDRYLVDTGVGSGSPTYPMKLAEGETLADGTALYRFRTDDFLGWVLEERHENGWRDVYSFTEERQLPVDFVAASFFCEKSPASIFNKAPMVSLRTEGGRITRDENEFRRFSETGVEVITPKDDDEIRRMMADWFGLTD